MTLWFSLAVLAQFMLAGTVLIDKYVLLNKGRIGNPAAYAFFVSILSGVVVLMIPFGDVHMPTARIVELSLGVGVSYVLGLIFLYKALKGAVPSDVMPVVAAVGAVASFGLAYILIGQDLPPEFALAFILFTVGTVIISHFRFTPALFYTVVFSGILFGLSSVLVKMLFMETTFLDGFFWSRMANVIGALLILLWPPYAHVILRKHPHPHGKAAGRRIAWLAIANKVVNGAAFILTLRAIQLGSVSVVNAVSGLQFVFLFVFAYIFAPIVPSVFRGEVRRPHEILHKLLATLAIALGMMALFTPIARSFFD